MHVNHKAVSIVTMFLCIQFVAVTESEEQEYITGKKASSYVTLIPAISKL